MQVRPTGSKAQRPSALSLACAYMRAWVWVTRMYLVPRSSRPVSLGMLRSFCMDPFALPNQMGDPFSLQAPINPSDLTPQPPFCEFVAHFACVLVCHSNTMTHAQVISPASLKLIGGAYNFQLAIGGSDQVNSPLCSILNLFQSCTALSSFCIATHSHTHTHTLSYYIRIMEWQVSYQGCSVLAGLTIEEGVPRPDLTEPIHHIAKDIRKKKSGESYLVSVNPDALKGEPLDAGVTPIYQPIGKIIQVLAYAEGSLKKAHLFAYVTAQEGTRVGGPNQSYECHLFKCKSDQDANAIAFATARTMTANEKRALARKADSVHALEHSVQFWNANNQPVYHFQLSKDDTVSGNLRVSCVVDASLKTVTKIVRLTNHITGDELIRLLAEKFNLGEIDVAEYALFDTRDSGDTQDMLSETDSPIQIALALKDPSETRFLFKKLPQGLVRVDTARPSMQEDTTQPSSTRRSSTSTSSSSALQSSHRSARDAQNGSARRAGSVILDEELGGETTTDDESPLGPLLPYHLDDEELLLKVMITRQSGLGLGFKLTPAYLLQMCIAYCSLHHGRHALEALLSKIAEQIHLKINGNLESPDVLLFWASNTLKLMSSLTKDRMVYAVFSDDAKPLLEESVHMALQGLTQCAVHDDWPADLPDASWQSEPELRAIIIDHYRTLDQNMKPESLKEVVARITAAMPSPHKMSEQTSRSEQIDNGFDTTQRLGFSSSATAAPMTSTPVANQRRGTESASQAELIQGEPGPPLPEEWEELVDDDTKHRFFANHKTRQTSWTDPRDKLITVTLVKGGKGLGLGISGAKRLVDGRLVLGIFVSSLVEGSAAGIDGTLQEGDEILEVNGHSLIGVDREGAIEFLKQVKHGEKVILLVSQQPRVGELQQKLRHTQL
eukprot:m.360492 g.360492  ORF g.360492 m.360492 type:complete len:895 (+) comp19070_c0_seq1:103-2787(+)